MKNINNNARIFLLKSKKDNRMDVYLQIGGGNRHYIFSVRDNYLLSRLQKGITIEELRNIRPKRGYQEQVYYRQTRRLLQVVECFIRHELAA